MHRIVRIILKTTLLLIVLIFILLFGLVRFTNGEWSDGETIIFGYNERDGHFQFNEKRTYSLSGVDGPYVISNSSVFTVDESNNLITSPLQSDSLLVRVNNDDKDQFHVHLKDHHLSDTATYELPSKLIVLSDIEGNFNAIASFLQTNEVIDQNFHWTYGKNHLLLLGDFVDRGSDVTQVLWLIYQLEQEAVTPGGQVHFILGNHEVMNIQGNVKYAKPKYKAIAKAIAEKAEVGESRSILYSKSSELGNWMRSKNSIEKLGPYLFVHAGLHLDIVELDFIS